MKKLIQNFVLLTFAIALQTISFGQAQTFLSEYWTGEGGEMAVFYRNVTKTDAQSNVYVAGSTLNTSNNNDIIVQKFDRLGTCYGKKPLMGQQIWMIWQPISSLIIAPMFM